ncbi:MAG: hypothetical protein WC735_04535 [Candidatus Paceibacterota bacterium]|jgi:hypothetical protein
MKRFRHENAFLEQIKTIPNISLACEKIGLSRNTIYRWCKEDPDFKNRLDEALGNGTESVNDLAESKLITLINSGNMQAIKYWLDNNKKNYMRPRPKNFWESLESVGHITSLVINGIRQPINPKRQEDEY